MNPWTNTARTGSSSHDPRRQHRTGPRVRRRVGTRRRRARRARARLAFDAAGAGARRRPPHPSPRPPRRTFRRVLRARDGQGDGPPGRRAVHVGNGGCQLPSGGARGAPRDVSRSSCAPRTGRPSCATRARARPSTSWSLYGGAVRWFCEVGAPEDRPGRGDAWRPSRPGPSRRPRGRRPGPCTSTWRSGSRSCRPASRWWTHRAGPTAARGPSPRVAAGTPARRGDGRARRRPGAPGPVRGARRGVGRGRRPRRPPTASPRSPGGPCSPTRSRACVPGPYAVSTYDALLRVPSFVAAHRPDLVAPGRCAAHEQGRHRWLGPEVAQVLVDPDGAWLDPRHAAAERLAVDAEALLDAVTARLRAGGHDHGGGGHGGGGWIGSWAAAERAARAALDCRVRRVAGTVRGSRSRATWSPRCPTASTLVVASSMPVRDVESFAAPRTGVAGAREPRRQRDRRLRVDRARRAPPAAARVRRVRSSRCSATCASCTTATACSA